MRSNHEKRMKLKYHWGKKVDSARVTRGMKGEGCKSYPLRIKCKTTTPLATLIRKWPWTVVAQLRLQSRNLLVCFGWDRSPQKKCNLNPPSVGLRWSVFKYKRKMKIHMWGIEKKEKKKDLVTKNWNIYTSEKETHIYKIDLPRAWPRSLFSS